MRAATPASDAPERIEAVLPRLRGLLPGLSGASGRVAEEVLRDPAGVSRLTIAELAARTGTSLATITRFCKLAGFANYADMRIRLAAETGRAEGAKGTPFVGGEIAPDDSLARVLDVIVSADVLALQETASQLNLTTTAAVADAIAAARRIDLYAVGGSVPAALEFQWQLHLIGRPTWCWPDVHAAMTSALQLRAGDVALAITHSGDTREVVESLKLAKEQGATTVTLTNYPASTTASIADFVLTTATRDTSFRKEALAARHAQLVVLDCLYVAVAQRTYPETQSSLDRATQAFHGRNERR
ncbi:MULTISPECIES: MurR/RpiR family transcriptional regulator [unclassified Micromonospora]|uniref:MurR/RpiR family transcriptional regulator n=1 Tax=unclassified Micromonospora TaxID=2617518 RepID=UPI0033284BAB